MIERAGRRASGSARRWAVDRTALGPLLLTGLLLGGCGPVPDDHVEIEDDLAIVYLPEDLTAEDFQTERDKALTGQVNQLRHQPLLEPVFDYYYREWKDGREIQLANASKVRVTENQYPHLFELVEGAALALELETPEIYVVASPEAKAYVTNVERPMLVINSRLVELLEPMELLFVIGHELGHVKADHMLGREIAGTMLWLLDQIPNERARSLVSAVALMSLLEWMRESELSADRAGLLVVGDDRLAGEALVKLVSGLSTEVGGGVDVDEYARQQQEVEEDAFLLRKLTILLEEARSTHPFVGTRVLALQDYRYSDELLDLLDRDGQRSIEIPLTLR